MTESADNDLQWNPDVPSRHDASDEYAKVVEDVWKHAGNPQSNVRVRDLKRIISAQALVFAAFDEQIRVFAAGYRGLNREVEQLRQGTEPTGQDNGG